MHSWLAMMRTTIETTTNDASACNIEKLGVGLGTGLQELYGVYYSY